MDSGNSGSMQSSSGGDEEYDSRGESISAFLNSSNSHQSSHVGPMPNPPPPQPPPPQHHHHQTHSSSSMFDPLSNYFDPLSRSPPLTSNPNSLLNLDIVWSKGLRSEVNCTEFGGFMATSSPTQHFLTNQQQPQSRATFPCLQIPQGHDDGTRGSVSGSVPATNDQTNTNNNNNMVRNPKKRSRASRRAPTTVLTTDTTNFRAMVQEFTGIPAPPFTSSPFQRSRLDLFGTASSTLRSSSHLDPSPPPYLLRPFAQKLHPPFLSSCSSSPSSTSSFATSSLIDAIASTSTTNMASGSASNSASTNSTAINYQLPSGHHLGLLKQQPQNLLNMNTQQHNQILDFQSLLQAPQKYPLSTSAILGTKQQGSLDISSTDSHLKMGVLEEFGLSHGHVGTNLSSLQNMVSSSDGTAPRSDNNKNDNDNNPANWGDGAGSNEGGLGLLRSINGNYGSSQRATNGRVNYPASSSDFHGDKGPENVTARSEGMVESWICSSD